MATRRARTRGGRGRHGGASALKDNPGTRRRRSRPAPPSPVMTLIFLAFALSADAFAAALCQGASSRTRPAAGIVLRVGLAFGGAQALMPVLGWALGSAFETVIRELDHWIAFVLLAFIGGRMIRESFTLECDADAGNTLSGRALVLTALATSVDAAAAGVTLAFMDESIWLASATIGVVTLVMAALGVVLGRRAGAVIGRRAEFLGGLVLIGIGTKILVEHLFFGG